MCIFGGTYDIQKVDYLDRVSQSANMADSYSLKTLSRHSQCTSMAGLIKPRHDLHVLQTATNI